MADDAPARSHDDDVHPVAAEPGALVEAVLGPTRGPDLADHVEKRALRRRAARRNLEEHGLAERDVAESTSLSRHSQVVSGTPRRSRDGNEHRSGRPDPREKDALVESVEPRAAPPPPGEQEGDGDHQKTHARTGGRGSERQDDSSARDQQRGLAHAVRRGQPEAKATGEQVSSRAKKDHGAATSRSCSIRAGPIPGIASSSSSEVNAPFFWR